MISFLIIFSPNNIESIYILKKVNTSPPSTPTKIDGRGQLQYLEKYIVRINNVIELK